MRPRSAERFGVACPRAACTHILNGVAGRCGQVLLVQPEGRDCKGEQAVVVETLLAASYEGEGEFLLNLRRACAAQANGSIQNVRPLSLLHTSIARAVTTAQPWEARALLEADACAADVLLVPVRRPLRSASFARCRLCRELTPRRPWAHSALNWPNPFGPAGC